MDGLIGGEGLYLIFWLIAQWGTAFLKSIDAPDICKTTEKIYKMMDDVVEEIGEDSVIQIVTDNATN